MLDVKRDVRIFGQERASYLAVPVRQLPSSLAGTSGEVCRPALAEKRPTGRVPVYPNTGEVRDTNGNRSRFNASLWDKRSPNLPVGLR